MTFPLGVAMNRKIGEKVWATGMTIHSDFYAGSFLSDFEWRDDIRLELPDQ